MANSKNTIQNIPLTGPLCLNTLKTDVTQFEGYNEKNTTVFGGELTPLWKKESEISSELDSYTIYNSKGHSFTIRKVSTSQIGAFELWDNQANTEIIGDSKPYSVCPITIKLDLPFDALWGGMYVTSSRELLEVYLSNKLKLYYRKIALGHEEGDTYLHWADGELDKAINELQWTLLTTIDNLSTPIIYAITGGYTDGKLTLAILYSGGSVLRFFGGIFTNTHQSLETYSTTTREPCRDNGTYVLTMTEPDTQTKNFYVVVENGGHGENIGKVGIDDELHFYKLTYDAENGWGEVEDTDSYAPMTVSNNDNTLFYSTVLAERQPDTTSDDNITTCSVAPYVFQICSWKDTIDKPAHWRRLLPGEGYISGFYTTGHDGNGFIPGIMGTHVDDSNEPFDFYCRGNTLTAITYGGMHIASPTSFSNNYVTVSKTDTPLGVNGLNYKSGNNWYFFVAAPNEVLKMFTSKTTSVSTLLKENTIIDNKYILVLSPNSKNTFIFDIESEGIVCEWGELGYVFTGVPIASAESSEDTITGCIYAGGYNAGYTVTGRDFVGYLENPYVMTYFPSNRFFVAWSYISYNQGSNNLQLYFSKGDSVQSAGYIGDDPELEGTIYPIDVNGNIILPIALSNRIVNGFSNNDMIILNGVAYPMMYYNNNQKLYSYQLLSGIDGITGVFSLQGQRYIFDDNTIYTANFDNGVVSNVQPVCYKKSLVYLGSLPKAAIFYSFYNKTFYQFTGDAIVSKMFEANDINEIYSVAQNPATLSLWICSDQGVYVMSDNDMFRLEYNSKSVFFYKNKTNVVSTDENGVTTSNVISLYKLEDGQIEDPIKLHTKFYGVGVEQKATYDCWYIRLHNKDHKAGKLKLKVNTITNTSFETEEKTFDIEPSMYDSNDTIFIRYQPKYQSAVATQLELESDIAIYQISLGVNTTDAVAQQSKFNF